MKISSDELTKLMQENLTVSEIEQDLSGYTYYHIPSEEISKASKLIREHFAENDIILTQMFGTDYPENKEILLIYSWWDITSELFFHIKVHLPYDNLSIKSISEDWEAVIWHEREAYEMLGVNFEGHPDLELPFLLPEEMVGEHPLRKSFKLIAREKEGKQ